MAGDGRFMYDNAVGGNDSIDAGAGNDELTGDGYWMSATAAAATIISPGERAW